MRPKQAEAEGFEMEARPKIEEICLKAWFQPSQIVEYCIHWQALTECVVVSSVLLQ